MFLHLWHTYTYHICVYWNVLSCVIIFFFSRGVTHRSCTCRHKKVGCTSVDPVITRNVAPTLRTRSNGITLGPSVWRRSDFSVRTGTWFKTPQCLSDGCYNTQMVPDGNRRSPTVLEWLNGTFLTDQNRQCRLSVEKPSQTSPRLLLSIIGKLAL